MRLNADFDQKAVVLKSEYKWVASPMPGVERMMLDRIGDEVARATSLVRYAPDSEFSPHRHDGGEEFLVLEGVFSDEHDDYPAGTYVRNPIGTAHRPRIGPEGALIFVKLHQFDPDDQDQVRIDTHSAEWQDKAAGVQVMPLHEYGTEKVYLVKAGPESMNILPVPSSGGKEILVLEGELHDEEAVYPAGSWARYPDGNIQSFSSGDQETVLYVKTGHLDIK